MNHFFTTSALTVAVVATSFWACQPSGKTTKGSQNQANNAPKSTTIRVTSDTSFQFDTLRLYTWEGVQATEQKIAIATKTATGRSFALELKNPEGLYFLGNTLQDIKPILLGVDKVISLKGGAKFGEYKFENSPNNTAYEAALARINADGQTFSGILYDQQNNAQNPEKLKMCDQQFATLDKQRKAYLDSIQKASPNIGRIVALYTYLSFANNKASGQIEADYFGRKYLQFVNFKDSVYYRLPYFYESIKNYASNLAQLGLNGTQQQYYLDSMILAKIPMQSPHYQSALLAAAFGMIGRNGDLFYKYGKAYQENFTGKNEMVDKFLTQQFASMAGSLNNGTEAPNFTDLTPEGANLSLKDLRGKVVLIDFWASWCGPCRKENPNVVKLYEKYKNKGFEILGVSLDQDKQRWLDAIKQDQLTWKHVSDLKGWASAAGKLYGVTGIPFTVLVDKQGKIIGKSLRGAALEAKLEEIFGK